MTDSAAPAQKPVIGLTGGIASGKSTVGRLLAEAGAAVVDADQVARDVVAKGSEGLREIVAAFGPQVLAADGTLDRIALAAVVFGDDEARKRLEGMLHPRIGRRSAELIAELRKGPATYVVYEAPLLVEVSAHKGLEGLIVVASSEETQLARATQRDASSREAIAARIAAQLPLERKLAAADYVIWNDGSLADLRRRTQEVHAQICARFGLTG